MKKISASPLAALAGACALVLAPALMTSAHGDTTAPADAAGSPPPAHHHHGPRGMGPLGFLANKLNLTQDQRQQIRTIMQASWQEAAPLHQQMQQLHQQIHDDIVANGYQDTQVRSLLQANSGLLVDLAAHRAGTMAKIRAVLTPSQQQQLDQLRAARPGGPGGFGPEF